MILTDAKVLLDMTLMLHQERVPTLTPTTPMLLDMIPMILTDAKVLLDMTLMLHQERVPTLTPTTPKLLDMIQTIFLVARALLDMTLMIPILQEKPLDTTPVVEKVHLDMTQAI